VETIVRCACGADATANGRECPRCFRTRLRSVRLDGSVTATRTKQNYYDRTSLDETFGDDRVDRYWDETDGEGALHRAPDGSFVHEDFRGERKVADDKVLAKFVGGEDAADVV